MCLQASRHLIRTGYNFSDMLKVVPPAVKCLICWEHENDLTELKVLVNSLYVLLTNNYLKRNFSTCAAVYKLVPLIGVHLQGENNCEGVDTKINNFFGLFMSLLNLRSWTVTGNKMRGATDYIRYRLCTQIARSTSWATGTILKETIRLCTIYMVIRYFLFLLGGL